MQVFDVVVVIYVGLCYQVEELEGTKPGPQLYGLYKSPPLDVVTTWSESYSVSVQADSHKASFNLWIMSCYCFVSMLLCVCS